MTRIVLIPGLLSDSVVWQALADRLGPYAVTADLTRDESMESMAARILQNTDGELVAIGHSMGGRVAMEMARQAPKRVRGLVLVSTGHNGGSEAELPKRHARVALGYQSMAKLADDWLPPMVAAHRQADEVLMQVLRDMVLRHSAEIHERQILALIRRPDAGSYLAEITCPAMLLVGNDDVWSPPAQHREILAKMPNAELHIIEGAGHFLPLENSQETLCKIIGWLDQTLQLKY